MAEYIDKDALLDDIVAAVENGGLGAVVAGTMKRYIMRVPADNVAPVVWISVKDRLPECEQEVLVRVKHKQYSSENFYYVTTTAMHEDGTMNTEDSMWFWNDMEFDYDEENDVYLVPEGWWEYRHYNPDDVYNNMIDGEVTHWMPLPEPPKEE